MPVSRLAHDADFDAIENVKVDLPHHTQKYRDTLLSRVPGLREEFRPAYRDDEQNDLIERACDALREAAIGQGDSDELQTAFERVEAGLSDGVSTTKTGLEELCDSYLTEGGFAPALSQRQRDAAHPVSAEVVSDHVTAGLATTLYQDVPRLAKIDDEVPRIDAPEDLHGLNAYLARREFTETSYSDLGKFLSCDTRAIREKFVPIVEQLHIRERSTRYDLERNRTLRFYLRSPGYLTAFRNQGVTDADRTDRLRVLLADHLRRLMASIGEETLLQYWRNDEHLVDYIFDVNNTPILFVSAFADQLGGSTECLEAFATEVTDHHLEVVIVDNDSSIQVTETESNRLRLKLPHWILLTVC